MNTTERLPPHAIEAEQGVLGCLLTDPNDCIPICIQTLQDNGRLAFYDLRHQTIYATLLAMYDARTPIDLITVSQTLKDAQALNQVGGLAYLDQIQNAIPSAANLTFYLEILNEKWLLRRMVQTCAGVMSRIYDYDGDAEELLDVIEKEVLAVNQSRAPANEKTIKTLVNDALFFIETTHQRGGSLGGLSTGLTQLDTMTDGLHGGEMWIIAARPSMGKTSMAMNFAEHIAVELGQAVGVFSLEMSAASLTVRLLCSMARINLRTLRDGFLSEADFPKLTNASGRLAKAPLHIDDTSGLTILQLRARARRMHQQHGIKLFVIDYLQLLHSTASRAKENRQQEIADISSGCKELAKELNVPIIVLSQLNRELEKDKTRKPRLSDLRESGSIEQDADLVGLLYKPDRDKDDDGEQDQSEACSVNLLIAKQRNGPTGDVYTTFLKSYTRFEARSQVSDDEPRKPYSD